MAEWLYHIHRVEVPPEVDPDQQIESVLRDYGRKGWLSTVLALAPTAGSGTGTVGLILPGGTADLSFEGHTVAVRKLAVYSG